jgi:AcrR family transcriptional regulator
MDEDAAMRKPTVVTETGRLTAADWVDAACLAIAEGGVGGVAVEPLARRLGVTKGSFYWHFPSRDALLRAALERWEREDTEGTIADLASLADPRRRLARLIGVAFAEHESVRDEPGLGLAFTLAVSDAADDAVVGPVLRRVSERRIAYLEQEMGALGLDAMEARYRALLAYAAYLGTLRLAREAPSRLPQGEELRAYHRHLLATLLHGVEGEGAGDTRQGRR